MAKTTTSLSHVLPLLLIRGAASMSGSPECAGSDQSMCESIYSRTVLAEKEDAAHGLELLQVKGTRKAEQIGEPVLKPPSTEAYNLDSSLASWVSECEHNQNASYFSQCRQDHILEPILGKLGKGFFVESGALDGQHDSNTLFYEINYGWSGLLIEPNPRDFGELMDKHRRAYAFEGALSDDGKAKKVQFSNSNPGAGYLLKNPEAWSQYYDVEAQPLHALLEKIGQSTVDFWSLDVEGSESGVLLNTDFSKVEVGVLLIEMNKDAGNNQGIQEAMKRAGFQDIGHTNWDHGVLDRIFVNPEYFKKRNLPVPTADVLEPEFRH